MPAELDYKTTEDGEKGEEAAVLLAEESAWHREGTVVAEEDAALHDLDRALEVAGLGFRVEKRPHYVKVEEEIDEGSGWGRLVGALGSRKRTEERLVKSEDSFSVVRLDRNEVIGTVGSRWQPLQNRDAFGPIQPALDDGLARIETAGSLRNGADVWMLVRFDRDEIFRRVFDDVDGEDVPAERELIEFFEEIAPYGLMTNDHSGTGKARVKETAIRVVCANTLDASLGEAVGYDVEVAHNTDVEERYAEATERIFSNIAGRYAALANFRTLFRDTRLEDDRAFGRLVLDPIVPILHLEEKIRRRDAHPQTEAALKRASRKRESIRDLYEGEGRGIDGEPTAWNAWNAAIEWIDHSPDASPNGRVKSLLGGTLQDAKQKSFRNLLDFAREEDPEARRGMVTAARGN